MCAHRMNYPTNWCLCNDRKMIKDNFCWVKKVSSRAHTCFPVVNVSIVWHFVNSYWKPWKCLMLTGFGRTVQRQWQKMFVLNKLFGYTAYLKRSMILFSFERCIIETWNNMLRACNISMHKKWHGSVYQFLRKQQHINANWPFDQFHGTVAFHKIKRINTQTPARYEYDNEW